MQRTPARVLAVAIPNRARDRFAGTRDDDSTIALLKAVLLLDEFGQAQRLQFG